MDFRFRWDERLHLRQDFTRVIQEGQRYTASGIVLWVSRQSDDPARKPRMGLAISGSYGNAVARNRLKRILREIFRLNKHRLPPGADLVFGARPRKDPVTYALLEPVITTLWTKAGLL
jgi:ribonuclease P protein component